MRISLECCILIWLWILKSLEPFKVDCVDHNKLRKILKEIGIPHHLTCLLRNLYAGQEVTPRTRHGTIDWFQIGKGGRQGCILSPCLFNFNVEYIMLNTGLDEVQAVIKTGEKYQYLQTHTWYHSTGESKEPLEEDERGEQKSWLKTPHSKT